MAMAGKNPPQNRPLAILARLLKLDIDQASKEIGSIAPFLIPFVKMACVYFVLDLPDEDPSPTSAFVKALPVLSLAWLVCLHGVRYGNAPSNYVTYNRRILYGLLFSIVGDILLVWQMNPLYFMLGMLSFTCTQICYILAFGFSPFGLKEFIPSLVGLVASMSIIYPCVSAGPMAYLVPVYGTLVSVMGWRSLACFNLNGEIPWKKIFSAVGAFLFVISDSFIAVNKFCYPIPFERTLIMVTYYAAQLCISLSVINFHLSSETTPTPAQPLQGQMMQGRPPGAMPIRPGRPPSTPPEGRPPSPLTGGPRPPSPTMPGVPGPPQGGTPPGVRAGLRTPPGGSPRQAPPPGITSESDSRLHKRNVI